MLVASADASDVGIIESDGDCDEQDDRDDDGDVDDIGEVAVDDSMLEVNIFCLLLYCSNADARDTFS